MKAWNDGTNPSVRGQVDDPSVDLAELNRRFAVVVAESHCSETSRSGEAYRMAQARRAARQHAQRVAEAGGPIAYAAQQHQRRLEYYRARYAKLRLK